MSTTSLDLKAEETVDVENILSSLIEECFARLRSSFLYFAFITLRVFVECWQKSFTVNLISVIISSL